MARQALSTNVRAVLSDGGTRGGSRREGRLSRALVAIQAATVTVDAYPDQRFPGRVAVVGDSVDPRTRTIPVRVEVANADARLKLDMFARIDLATDATQPGLAVRREAVQTLEGRQVVFVKSGDTDFMVREVDTGRLSGPLV